MIEEAPSYAKREREQERIAAQEAAAQQAAEDERARQLLGASRRERIVMLGLQGLRGGKR